MILLLIKKFKIPIIRKNDGNFIRKKIFAFLGLLKRFVLNFLCPINAIYRLFFTKRGLESCWYCIRCGDVCHVCDYLREQAGGEGGQVAGGGLATAAGQHEHLPLQSDSYHHAIALHNALSSRNAVTAKRLRTFTQWSCAKNCYSDFVICKKNWFNFIIFMPLFTFT